MDGERLRTRVEAGIAEVVLARAAKRNAMDGPFFEALPATFRALGADPSVRAVLLVGEGEHFTAGLDLGWAAGQFAPAADAGRWGEKQLRLIQWLQDAVSAVEACRVPVVAAIHGGCIGAGVDLVSACDIRVASADAWFQIAEIDLAITADLGTLQRLPHIIPGGVARELALTGRKMAAEEALRWGLVSRVEADRGAAVSAGREIAATLAAKPPLAAIGTKRILNEARGRTVADSLQATALYNAAALNSLDLAEAMRSRAAKEAPRFADLEG